MASPKPIAVAQPTGAPISRLDRINRGVQILVAVLAGLLAWWASVWAGANLVATYPIGYRENAIILSTKLLLEGKDPYSLQNQPLYVNVYGILYTAVAAVPARIWGPTYAVHRAVSLFFLVASCGLMAYALRRRGNSWPMTVTGAMILFTLWAGNLNIESRPDSLGLFLMLASLIVPWSRKFSTGSLAVSGLLGILGLMTKPYCVLGALLVAAYVFLFRSKARGLIFGGALCAALAVVILVVNACLVCYWTNVFFINLNSVGPSRSGKHLVRILTIYVGLLWGLLALVGLRGGLALVGALRSGDARAAAWKSLGWDLHHAARPVWSPGLELGTFVLICNAVVIFWKMGWHNGANTLYWHHLLSPWLVWVGLPLVSAARWRWLKLVAGVVAMATIVQMAVRLGPELKPESYSAEWEQIESVISRYNNVFGAPPLCLLLQKDNKPFYDTGQTEYFRWGANGNPCGVAEEYRKAGARYAEQIHRDMVNKKFDLLCLAANGTPLVSEDDLDAYYEVAGSLPMPMPYNRRSLTATAVFWVPKK